MNSEPCDGYSEDETLKLGQGSYGFVKTVRTPGGNLLALKSQESLSPTEYRAGSLTHPNLMRYLDLKLSCGGDNVAVLMNMYSMDLETYNKSTMISSQQRVVILKQLLDAIAHLHYNDLLHLDIKPGNVMMDFSSSEPRPILTDFGSVLSGRSTFRLAPTYTTMIYREPRNASHVNGQNQGLYSRKSDLYSFGVICYQLLTRVPFYGLPLSNNVLKPLELEFIEKLFKKLRVPDYAQWARVCHDCLNGHLDTFELLMNPLFAGYTFRARRETRQEFRVPENSDLSRPSRIIKLMLSQNLGEVPYHVALRAALISLTSKRSDEQIAAYTARAYVTRVPRPDFDQTEYSKFSVETQGLLTPLIEDIEMCKAIQKLISELTAETVHELEAILNKYTDTIVPEVATLADVAREFGIIAATEPVPVFSGTRRTEIAHGSRTPADFTIDDTPMSHRDSSG